MTREFVERLRTAGFSLRVEGDDLVLTPWSKLPAEAREALRADKATIIAYLRLEPPSEGRLLSGGRRWIPPPSRPGWCPCNQERVWERGSGLCRVCHAAVFGRKIPAGRARSGR